MARKASIPPTLPTRFWSKVETLLPRCNLKPATLAAKIGVTRSMVSDWKKKGVLPQIDVAIKVARELDVCLDCLADDQLELPNEEQREADRRFKSMEPREALARLAGPSIAK